MRLAAQLTPFADTDQRAEPRRRTRIGARLREHGSMGYPVDVLDISSDGFKAERREPFAAGSYAWLTIPGVGAFNARIIWIDSFRLGCEFVTPLADETVARIIATAPN